MSKIKKEVLIVDCCIRGKESRTGQLMNAFKNALPESSNITVLNLMDEDLKYLSGEYFEERQKLLDERKLDHPRFKYAHQFADADIVAIAAPFWDLMFPALLKVYIEQISVDGITFGAKDNALAGLCRGSDLVFITTRGGSYAPGSGLEGMDIGSAYMSALKDFFGFDHYHMIAADGLDIYGADADALVAKAIEEARALAQAIVQTH